VSRVAEPVNPAAFGDPVALKTSWQPANPEAGGSRLARLVEVAPDRLEFRPSALAYAVFGGLSALGLGGVAVGVWLMSDGDFRGAPIAGFSVMPLIMGGWILGQMRRHAAFDRREGLCWIARKTGVAARDAARSCSRSSIHALQILREWLGGPDQGSLSYELNLVLKDGRRLHLVDHDELQTMRADAARLARFLGCKVWDAGDSLADGATAATPDATTRSTPGAAPGAPEDAPRPFAKGVVGLFFGALIGLQVGGFLLVFPEFGKLVDPLARVLASPFGLQPGSVDWLLPSLVGAFVGSVVAPIAHARATIRASARARALAEVGRMLGYGYTATQDPPLAEQLGRGFGSFFGFMKNVLSKISADGRIAIGDLRLGTRGTMPVQTAAYFQSRALRLPAFVLRPEAFLLNLSVPDLDFEANPDFSRRYHLLGPDEAAIRRLFAPEVLTALAARPGLYVESSRAGVIVFVPRRLYEPAELPQFVNGVNEVYGLLERAGRTAGFVAATAPAAAVRPAMSAATTPSEPAALPIALAARTAWAVAGGVALLLVLAVVVLALTRAPDEAPAPVAVKPPRQVPAAAAPPVAAPADLPVGGPAAADVDIVEPHAVRPGRVVTLHGKNFGTAENHVVHFGGHGVEAMLQPLEWTENRITLRIPEDAALAEGLYYWIQIETREPPALAYRESVFIGAARQAAMPADAAVGCRMMPLKYRAACEAAQAGQGPCVGKSGNKLESCLMLSQTPADACATLPASQRPLCEEDQRAVAACRGTLQQLDACMRRVSAQAHCRLYENGFECR
jgi:hypothetical protein